MENGLMFPVPDEEINTYATDPNVSNSSCAEIPLSCPTSQSFSGISGSLTESSGTITLTTDPFDSTKNCAEVYYNFDTDTNGFRVTYDGDDSVFFVVDAVTPSEEGITFSLETDRDDSLSPINAALISPQLRISYSNSGSYLYPIQFPRGGQGGDTFEPGCYGFRIQADSTLTTLEYSMNTNRV